MSKNEKEEFNKIKEIVDSNIDYFLANAKDAKILAAENEEKILKHQQLKQFKFKAA